MRKVREWISVLAPVIWMILLILGWQSPLCMALMMSISLRAIVRTQNNRNDRTIVSPIPIQLVGLLVSCALYGAIFGAVQGIIAVIVVKLILLGEWILDLYVPRPALAPA